MFKQLYHINSCISIKHVLSLIAIMSETRYQRFKRLANKRANKALNQLRILGNLANRSYYDYNEDDINKMFKAINFQLKIVKGKFHTRPKKFRL